MNRPTGRRIAGVLATSAALVGGTLLGTTPAHAAWGTTYPVSVQVTYYNSTGGATQIGRADGWVQFDDGGNTFRYSFNVCRQSSYTWPRLQVAVDAGYAGPTWTEVFLENYSFPNGNPTTPTAPCYGDTDVVSGQDTYTNPWNVEFVVTGDYYGASGHGYKSSNYTVGDPY
ncbi:hypothetical protein Caci_3800 [Catenulispora acidiphila DSM 44928]|uniref:Secreted protein n=1 Tax=Catenulispora acidiphila (strain DSM 44928 / JCM 14897 / NBRC 102108 / NRRL B-24433 / ID139908) TaxID=479433 RepID=C7QDA9_CATAD|nr:hypothetical protein [Catenulispora acidiphila]ACU72702.1 hypothetical protein Caci_3800 [Catenulispora acidiphila DSM 44928]